MKRFFYGPLHADRRAGARLLILTACLCCGFGGGLRAAALLEDTTAKKAVVVVAAPGEVKPLQVGDKVPDMEFQMMNYASPTARLSDFRGKLVILDFWATWCSSCIAHFPENERLQKEFGDRIQILLVNAANTGDKKDKIESFLKKKYAIKDEAFKLPIVVGDTLADNYFPHRLIPHYAWIDEDGNVIAITASNEVNDKNIKNVIDRKAVTMLIKDDKKLIEDFSTPFLVKNVDVFNDLYTFSIFTGELKMDLSVQFNKMDARGLCIGTRMLNTPLWMYFAIAYPEMNKVPYNRWIVNVSDSLVMNNLINYKTTKTFCYEFITKKAQPLDTVLHKYLKDDLSKSFHCRGHLEYKKTTCYVIFNLEKKKEVEKKTDLDDSVTEELMLPDFLNNVNTTWKIPIVSDVNTPNSEIKIKVPREEGDFSELKKNLNVVGYDVKIDTRELSYFIISEN